MSRYIAHFAQQKDKDERRDELEQELCLSAQAEVLLFAQLLPVIKKADDAEDECEKQNKYMRKVAAAHGVKAHRQADEGAGAYEDNAAHRGRSGL